jgi:hypothetical protein
MPFDTYADLTQAVARWLARGDLEPDIPDFIRLTEVELARDLPIREQEKEFRGTMVAGQDYLELPDDCLWPRHLRIDTNPAHGVNIVSVHDLTALQELYSGSEASVATTIGNRLHFAPGGSAGGAYTLFYHAGLPGLSEETPTNQVLRMAPDCYLYGALMHSAPFLGSDERIATWGALFKAAKDSFKRLEFRARTGGGPLRMRPDVKVSGDGHSIGGR